MYLVLIAWMYVALMMAVAEATSPVGTVLGAIFTFVLYGAVPMGVVGYIMGSPARKRAIKAKEMAERETHQNLNAQASEKENSKS
jgi:mannose/fructose/N-acetylgalactosamine-specific phosphotransferase system component IID